MIISKTSDTSLAIAVRTEIIMIAAISSMDFSRSEYCVQIQYKIQILNFDPVSMDSEYDHKAIRFWRIFSLCAHIQTLGSSESAGTILDTPAYINIYDNVIEAAWSSGLSTLKLKYEYKDYINRNLKKSDLSSSQLCLKHKAIVL